ncbi:hypothetical protein [Pseudoalteromonas denitrificans]|uniref:Lipoprotein n=1 Tax=Pseudoalteromonas denitrificans DSM 6059 TaxID=1123010 RepID=A0A1I1E4I0_9GAMM|nr:hypothetical protein [Pseudoalteromonas denitrificans]SFB81576.1 hypothetical protein SAMN02745724_00192 [Pseudoalteromonas denitrificans DSM 6059]
MKALAVFLTIFMLLTGCSVSKKQETREYQLESKRCGQTYFQCTNTCGSKKIGFELCNAKCIDQQNQCLEFAERLKVITQKD